MLSAITQSTTFVQPSVSSSHKNTHIWDKKPFGTCCELPYRKLVSIPDPNFANLEFSWHPVLWLYQCLCCFEIIQPIFQEDRCFWSAERWPITTNMLITTPDGVGAAPCRVLLLSASVQPSVGRLCSHRQLVTIIIYTIVYTNIALARSFPQLHVSINIQFHMSLFSILHMCLANVLSFLLFTPLPSLSFPLTMIIIVASNIISSKSPRDTWGWKQGRVWEKRRWKAQVGKIQFWNICIVIFTFSMIQMNDQSYQV